MKFFVQLWLSHKAFRLSISGLSEESYGWYFSWPEQRWAIWDKNGQKSATLLPSSILHSSSTLQIMSITLPLSGVEEWKSGRVITLPLLSIKKASAKASANSRRVEEWKSGRSITLPLPGVEEWKIATLPLSEWKSDRPDCPSLS